MNKISKNEKGFSAVEIVMVVVIIALIGVVGWMVYKNHHRTSAASTTKSANSVKTTSSSTNSSTTKTNEASNPYAGWQTYTSKSGGYTIKYPSDWTIEGFSSSQNSAIQASNLTGNENSILLYSSSAKANSFGLWLINDTKYETTANSSGGGNGANATPYSDGSVIKTLSNGMNIWSQSQSTDNTGDADFEAVTDGQFGYKLNSGTFLQISMGFGFAYKQTTSYSYSQQVSSPQLTQAESILTSLSQ
jgi:cytoskeletal protein RodZ